MKKNTYLEDYFQKNNLVVNKASLDKKILNRFIAFILVILVYYVAFFSKSSHHINVDITTSTVKSILNIIMYISVLITGTLIFFGFCSLVIKQFGKKIKNLTYNTKKNIFNFLDWFLVLPVCATIMMIMFTYIFVVTPIDGYSMYPTINNDDRVLVSYLSKVDRFDIIVLKVTEEDNYDVYGDSYYIKRVIGVAGDVITFSNKTLIINNKVIDEYYFPDNYYDDIEAYRNFDGCFKYKENGVEKITYKIPKGFVFVMGDNRNDAYKGGSKDSRQIGLIPIDNILGVAEYKMNSWISGGKI